MQNRLATAILMAVGGSLAIKEKAGIWTSSDTGNFLESVRDISVKLLKGETVMAAGDYPPMQLTGNNIVQNRYNDVTKELLYAGTFSSEVEGYKE